MDVLSLLEVINKILSVAVGVMLFGNVLYPIIALFHRRRVPCGKPRLGKYAVMICARNEEAVIGHLIESIKAQDYPGDLLDIFVLADNCNDRTADVSAQRGAEVFVRHDDKRVGKGYALNYLYAKIILSRGDIYDGFFIFDADNLLPKDFVSKMDASFKGKNTVLTSIRNTKNFGDSWVSAGFAVGWLFQTGLLNVGRAFLGIPCFINGTGFLVGSEVLKGSGGWNFFTLTEDCEFTVYCALNGIEINVCSETQFFDEQPASLGVSWTQRLRWAKGKYQVFGKYWRAVCKGFFSKRMFVFFDAFTNIFTVSLLVLFSSVLSFLLLAFQSSGIMEFTASLMLTMLKAYVSVFLLGEVTVALWWRNIYAGTVAKLLLPLLYPLHIAMYMPIALVAVFKSVKWTPIKHGASKSAEELFGGKKR